MQEYKALKVIVATALSICLLVGCGKEQSVSSNTSSDIAGKLSSEDNSRAEEVEQILSSIDSSPSKTLSLTADEKTKLATALGDALVSGEQKAIDASFFGKGKTPHSYDLGLKYPFADVSGLSCESYKVSINKNGEAEITVMISSAGKTLLEEGENTYLLNFALGNDSAFERGVVTMMLPAEKYMSQKNTAVSLVDRFRSWVSTDVFTSVEDFPTAGLIAYLFVVGNTNDVSLTGKEISQRAKDYLDIPNFVPHKSANFAGVQYDSQSDSYAVPKIDGNYSSGMGVRAIAYKEDQDGLCEIVYEGYEDGLFVKPAYKLTYTLRKTGEDSYAIISCE